MKKLTLLFTIALVSLLSFSMPLVIDKDDGEPPTNGGGPLQNREKTFQFCVITCFHPIHQQMVDYYFVSVKCPPGNQTCTVVNGCADRYCHQLTN